MAADNESQYPGDASGQTNPALTQVLGGLRTGEAQQWAGAAAAHIQDYLTKKAVVADNQAAGDEFISNLADTRRGLASWVQDDPGALDTALSLVPHIVNGLVAQHGHLPEDQRVAAATDTIGDMQTEVAHAGVQKLAELDRGQAYKAIDDYSKYLPDDHQAALRTYADVMEQSRAQDAIALQRQAAQDRALTGYAAASQHLSDIADQDTGRFRAKPGFISALLGDTSLAPETKMALHAGYSALVENGDVSQSSPHIAADLIGRIGSDNPPQQGEILSHLGTGLTLRDAGFLNSLLGPASGQREADLRSLADVVGQARDTLAAHANGPAGQVAFGRFTSWLLPALQRGANLTELMADNRIQQFAPTAADHVAALPRPTIRPPLHEIFRAIANG